MRTFKALVHAHIADMTNVGGLSGDRREAIGGRNEEAHHRQGFGQ